MQLNRPKQGSHFSVLNSRLALLHATSSQDKYWNKYWNSRSLFEYELSQEQLFLQNVISKWIKRGPVLDAGCGPAHHVRMLTGLGHKVIGVDSDSNIVNRMRTLDSRVDIRHGDIRALDFPSSYLGGYISLGVFEHFSEGPMAAMTEARRVLANNGIALISVPHLNPVRESFLRQIHYAPDDSSGLSFHQYYFSSEEFSCLLSEAGLKVIAKCCYGHSAFLTREHPVFSLFWHSKLCREKFKTFTRPFLRALRQERFAHMMLYVCAAQ